MAGGGELLIRFTGPELWWLLTVARWAAAIPGASVPVPAGPFGALTVAAAGVAAVVLSRWRWTRLGVCAAVVCLMGWTLTAVGAA